MSISEDQLAALEADVAELLGILEQLDSEEALEALAGMLAKWGASAPPPALSGSRG